MTYTHPKKSAARPSLALPAQRAKGEQILRQALRLPDESVKPSRRNYIPSAHSLGSRIRFSRTSAMDEPTDFRDREECHDATARLTVYALNAAVMLFYFPVGFALLIFNILGGENLRTTAHTMALTGMGTALTTAGYAGQLFG